MAKEGSFSRGRGVEERKLMIGSRSRSWVGRGLEKVSDGISGLIIC